MVHTTGGIAIRLATEIIAGRSRLLLPDWRIYYLFEVEKGTYVLRSMSMKFELQRLGRSKLTADFFFKSSFRFLISAILVAAWLI